MGLWCAGRFGEERLVGMRSVWKLLIQALDVRDPNKDDGNEKKRELLLVAV